MQFTVLRTCLPLICSNLSSISTGKIGLTMGLTARVAECLHCFMNTSNQSDMINRTTFCQLSLFTFSLTFCVHRHFRGANFGALNGTMSRHLRALLKAEMPLNQKDWKDEGLFNLSYSLLFK